MALKPITRQEQIIAGKGLEPITRMERFLKEYGGGGGASSWNDLADKPFGETTVMGDTLYWDGNTDGLAHCNIGTDVYLVSEATPSLDELANGIIVRLDGGEEYNMSYAEAEQMYNAMGVVTSQNFPAFIIIYGDNFEANGLVFPKAGIYLMATHEGYVSALTIPNYGKFESTVVKTIDPKYLPKASMESAGIIKKSDIIQIIRAYEALPLRIGETTFNDLLFYSERYILPSISWNEKYYICITLTVTGFSLDGRDYVGKAKAIAIEEDTGKVCSLDIDLDGVEDNSLVTNVAVSYVYGE